VGVQDTEDQGFVCSENNPLFVLYINIPIPFSSIQDLLLTRSFRVIVKTMSCTYND
jgi:hypothetical protein